MSWAAEFLKETLDSEQRIATRRKLGLAVAANWSEAATSVLIHNLSTTGLLIETEEKLALGETFDLTLPEIGATEVAVVWASDNFYGCEFAKPISTGTVSASLLRAPIHIPSQESTQTAFPAVLADYPAHLLDHYESEPIHTGPELSSRSKLLIILGSSLTMWAIIGAAGWLLFW